MTDKNYLDFLPTWYITEREAEQTIEKLTDNKELGFYLENPDPFIRRLAIIRCGQLERKDSYSILHRVLDDNLENEENRELAALFMQQLNTRLNLGFFINNKYLNQFTGEEDIDSLFAITIKDTLPDVELKFENTIIESQLHFDNEFIKCSIDEKDDALSFSLKDWLNHYKTAVLRNLCKGLKAFSLMLLLLVFIKAPKALLCAIKNQRHKAKIRKAEHKSDEKFTEEPRAKRQPRSEIFVKKSRTNIYRTPFSSKIKGIARYILNILFIPFRFIFHFKWIILSSLLVIYSLISFTAPGKSLLFRISSQAYYNNTVFISQTKDFVTSLIASNNTLAGIFGIEQLPQKTGIQDTNVKNLTKKLSVTAPKGLYLRGAPNSTAKKIVLMQQNTIVSFMEEETKDDSGNIWFKVGLSNGSIGWANSRYLKEE